MLGNIIRDPYYEHAGITLYHGDCREILPSLESADLCLTDPPYGINLNTDNRRFRGGRESRSPRRGGTGGGAAIAGDGVAFDPGFLLGIAAHQIIWGWNHFPDRLPRGACLVWLKKFDSQFGSFLSDAELAWMSKGHGVYCMRDTSNNGLAAKGERVHPTQKPISLMSWCLSFFSKAQTVVDPFAGSGTTLEACQARGLKCVGIEIEERFCEAAANRLLQGGLF